MVLDSDVGTPTVSIISYDIQQQSQEVIKLICPDGESQETIDAAYSKAIYRMCCIGFIDDFTRDYSKRTFRIVCIRKPSGEYYENLKIYFRRYFSEEKANREVEAAKSLGKGNEVLNCLAYLTEFIYEKLATKKKRSIDEIRSFCSEGIEKNKIQDWKKLTKTSRTDSTIISIRSIPSLTT